ncbi:MAG: bifunctional 5,10-methylenetetrahydrofolate dehydrogenase/5,10-methenyltetrahydrofolate cyclohydrolase [Parcubacteria group bacterium]|nr:bifunctional 5,10-methylenetetrahydrofolate dehydrogenase/5,10-methenyltetrahydrofolate cyclohydrolase [Parcubacteria group bacterium]
MSAIIFDGKRFAEEMLAKLKEKRREFENLRLDAVLAGNDSASFSFLKEKEKAAKALDIDFKLHQIDENISNTQLRKEIVRVGKIKSVDGLIVQLPLPKHINTQYILNAISPEKDIDVLSQKSLGAFYVDRSKILPPTVEAIKKVFEVYLPQVGKDLSKSRVVIVGAGRLVGKPIAVWLINQKRAVSIIDVEAFDLEKIVKEADILISGVGQANLIKKEMVKDGVFALDFGYSKIDGKNFGDIDESVKEKASFFTPAIGGLGPVTVASLAENIFKIKNK